MQNTSGLITPILAEFEASLNPPPSPVGNYVTAVRIGNLLFTSGMLPLKDGELQATGALSKDDPEAVSRGQAAARLCVENALNVAKSHLGSLSCIEKVVKVTGFVSSEPGFTAQPQVMNGASDRLVALLGEDIGKHARSAVGVASLPMNASVEVELILQVREPES